MISDTQLINSHLNLILHRNSVELGTVC